MGDIFFYLIISFSISQNMTSPGKDEIPMDPRLLENYWDTTVVDYRINMKVSEWARPIDSAAASWNGLANVKLHRVGDPKIATGFVEEDADTTDGKNVVTTLPISYPDPQGRSIIAETRERARPDGTFEDCDIVINLNKHAYFNNGKYDVRRVVKHEFGHVLGLKRPCKDLNCVMRETNSGSDSICPLEVQALRETYKF
jgi:hypothetical protein